MRRATGCIGGSLVLVLAHLAAAPGAWAQDRPGAPEPKFSAEAAAGLQVYYTGHAQSVAFGFSPNRSITLLVTAHRSHIEDDIDIYPDGYAATRGGTEQFVSAEFRYAFLPHKRVSPYALIGRGRGTSRPNVSEFFPDKKQRNIDVFFYGGGVRTPVRPWLDAFVDVRLIMAGEGRSDYFGVQMPVRAGMAWRF